MRLCMTNGGLESKFGYKGALKMLKDCGFEAVDYNLCARSEEHQLGEDYVEQAKEMRAYMDEIGLVCVQTHGPFPIIWKYPLDDTYERVVLVKRAIEFTAILGAPVMVLHSIEMPKELYGQMIDYNYRMYKYFEPYAKKFGIKIAIENLYIDDKRQQYYAPGRFSTPELMDSFLDKLDSDIFCMCLDTGHAALCGVEPWVFVDNLKHKDAVAGLHVHDVDYNSDTHTLPFNIRRAIGGIDWEKTMHSLYEAGYKGDLTFESGGFHFAFPNDLIPEALKFTATIGRYLISLFK